MRANESGLNEFSFPFQGRQEEKGAPRRGKRNVRVKRILLCTRTAPSICNNQAKHYELVDTSTGAVICEIWPIHKHFLTRADALIFVGLVMGMQLASSA